ncbi:AI-2E family transporter [Roseovarius tibetensis]|uniref:AI-2E family transporter n=1 Tax=Roseovarius tibetensis TaxID=2685897 RepID=UPI003D7F529A
MALPVRQQLKYWGIAMAVFALALWFLGNVILPFILGGAIAYFLDPVADRLQRLGLSRMTAVVVITLSVLLLFTLLLILVVPTLVSQAIALFEITPQLARDLQGFFTAQFPSLFDADSPARETLIGLGETIRDRGVQVLETALSSAASLLNIVVLLVVAPVVAVYLLYDWDHMIQELDHMLPRDHAPIVRKLAQDIDSTLASFIRGMGTVCLILGTYYAVALMLVGLQFGLVVGAVAGLLTFIPYVGAIIGGVLAIGLALFQFWGQWFSIILVAGIFVSGQVIEGNFLTPKLVGSSVGLHPVWLIFALSAFGTLFGFVGMLVAVPVAAALGVIARFVIAQYKSSRLYRGLDSRDDG